MNNVENFVKDVALSSNEEQILKHLLRKYKSTHSEGTLIESDSSLNAELNIIDYVKRLLKCNIKNDNV